MTSLHLVDPDLLGPLQAFPELVLTPENLPAYRAGASKQLAAVPPQPSHATVSEHFISGPADAPPVRVLMYRPAERIASRPALLHIHGGGYVLGSPDMNGNENRLLADSLGCIIVSVDYRLAPDTPHPGPLEDCYAALTWLHTNAAELNIDPERIGIKGESAGGGLAAALALMARDIGEFVVAFQHLIYPMLDDRTGVSGDEHPFAGQFVWSRAANRFGWDSLLGQSAGSDVANASYAAAARAQQLAALPPTYIAVGALELFLEENLEYARRLTRAGVPVELHVYPGAYHGFDALAPTAQVSLRARHDSTEALRRALYGANA